MNRDNDRQTSIILAVLGILPIVWLGLLIAPSVKGGLPEILPSLMNVMSDPFHIVLCEDSVKTVLVLLLCYGMGIGIYFSTRRNYRRREEHGSAKWGNAKAVDKKYRQNPPSENKLMTQAVRIGLNGKKHRRNLNTLVCGGSGAGKTRFYCKPNLMQANTSFVILDPKGEIVRDVGNLLEKKGYEIRVLDLISMEKSHCYNPFVYLHSDNDVQRLVTNLFKSTTPKGSQSNDPFWDTSASMLLSALVYYLHYEAPEDEQNFAMVMEMLQAAAIDNEEDPRPSPLDCLFADLELDRPDHIALKYYRSYHTGSAKTLKSIQITLAARLEKFNLESLAALTCTDELDLASMGEKKVALFAIIPDNDSSFNFLVSILYTQLFQQLFFSADHIHGGALPIPVHFLMDEFANVSLPDDFDKILSVMRSRGVFVSIILQNLAQLKALFEKQWESIVGNCDEFLYLGGNEQSTHKYVSELLGNGSLNTFAKKTNVDTDNRLICYDILDLGKQLMPIGMLVVLDSILNRITQNRAKGKNTFIFIDEIYLLFQHEYSANFLFTLWKRVRKYGAYATGITQNVDDLLQSHTARTMLANSEFIVMLNQASTDRLELAKLLNISDTQLSYITNVDAGHGLIKVGSSLVPFANKFPKNTKLYKLMTTKPGEGA